MQMMLMIQLSIAVASLQTTAETLAPPDNHKSPKETAVNLPSSFQYTRPRLDLVIHSKILDGVYLQDFLANALETLTKGPLAGETISIWFEPTTEKFLLPDGLMRQINAPVFLFRSYCDHFYLERQRLNESSIGDGPIGHNRPGIFFNASESSGNVQGKKCMRKIP